ncbi:MAG TPA: LysE family translocator [Devosia sp.]|jgi:threonine/homoserine/homoserine lactone efflux protein|uniref:LysE family translocator n=1 Tax=Devosia sp. TaxID=1871048 RepID=UPI002F9482B0
MLEAFLAAWVGCILAQASPGPNMMATASAALGQGRRTALLVVLGISTGSLLWAAGVSLGLGALFAAFPLLLILLKFVGGLYLLWIAVRSLRSILANNELSVAARQQPLGDFAAWRYGLFVVMTNPKAALMWSAVATFLFGAGLGRLEVVAFGPLVALSAFTIYGFYGLLFSTGVAMRAYGRFWRAIEGAFGLAFGALGMTLLAWGVRDLRS